MLSNPQKSNSFRKAIFLLLLFVTTIPSVFWFCAPWVSNLLVVDIPLTHADVIVVMAGDRIHKLPVATELLKKGVASKILLTNDGVLAGWSAKKQQNLFQVDWAEEELIVLGVDREQIVKLPYYGSATIFDALAVKVYLTQNHLGKIIVVTSDYHTRRCYWAFRHVLKNFPHEMSVLPVQSLNVGLQGIAWEYVKLGYYILKYGLLGLMPDMSEVSLKNS